jgi:riboflavin kinase/FMN adenylyltransferase
MRIVRGLESYPPDSRPGVVALGVFDGLHLGHRTILGTAVARAQALGVLALACTFDPHPMEVLQPDRAGAPIMTLDERLQEIAGLGIETTVVLQFTSALAGIEPEAFIGDIVVARLRAREIVVGFNHRFGRGARGDVQLLQDLAPRLGFAARVVPPTVVDGGPVSSTEIRACLQRGDVQRAARLLGRDYSVAGDIVRGAGRGQTLGFPTANLRADRALLIPLGVYACRAELEGTSHPAVVNIGHRPTFGEKALVIEAHLLDFSGDLYGRRVRLRFVRRLRPEVPFVSVDALRAQIDKDIEQARQLL